MHLTRSQPKQHTRWRVRIRRHPGRRANRVTPLWSDLLAARGLSPATIAHFRLRPRGKGWTYPVQPGLDCMRWKAFDSSARPKYRWLPGKLPGTTFYDPDGQLAARIAAAGGELWLAAGEADVWALWEGGLHNATCMFDGEAKNVPPWFVDALRRLDVRAVHIAPDRDRTGILFAQKLRQTLDDAGIPLSIRALPFPPDSKADIGRLLQTVGAARLRAALEGLPPLALPVEEPRPPAPRPAPPLPDYADLYERWCVEEVEAAALRAWHVTPPDGKGFSKNFRCPFHDDQHPSAGWNYHTHGVHCFACGSHDTHEVAEALGVRTWEQYKADHPRPAPTA